MRIDSEQRIEAARLNPSTLARLVTETMGGGIDPVRVDNLIAISEENGFLFHGIKNGAHRKVNQEGVLPLTPEGGNVSYWNSGNCLFGYVTWQGTLQTMDSSFFNYSFSDLKSDNAHMLLAVTRKADVVKIHPSFDTTKPGVNTISVPVPKNSLHLLRVEGSVGTSGNAREKCQQAERCMFDLLEHVVEVGYHTGGLDIRKINLG